MTGPQTTYPAMRDTGREWLGRVPRHWDVQPLGRLGTFSTGRGGDKRDEDPAGIPCIRHGDLDTTCQRFVVETRTSVSRARAGEYTPTRFGDVLFAATGESAEDAGRSAVNLIRSAACCGRNVVRFRPNQSVDARYLGYATGCLLAAGQRAASGRGKTVSHLYPDELKRLIVALPPIAEQGAIVRFLERAEKGINGFIEAKRGMIALLEEHAHATVHRAMTGQIDVRTGRPYPDYRESRVSWLGNVPRHWVVERLKSSMGNIEELCTERRRDDSCVTLNHVESRTGRLRRFALDSPPVGEMKRFAAGDVLFGKPRPHLARVACPSSGGLCVEEFLVLRPLRSAFTGRFVARLLRSKPMTEAVRNFACDAALPRAEWRSLGGLHVIRPPIAEQNAIVRYLDEAAAGVDDCISRIERQIELAREYGSRLIADAVTGKYDVRVTPVTPAELVPFTVGSGEDAGDIVPPPDPVARPAPIDDPESHRNRIAVP